MTYLMTTAGADWGPAWGPGWGPGPWHDGGPGWWIVFPILFWVLLLSGVGYLIYRRSPGQVARAAAEQVLAERFARGEITEDELRQRRAALRGQTPPARG